MARGNTGYLIINESATDTVAVDCSAWFSGHQMATPSPFMAKSPFLSHTHVSAPTIESPSGRPGIISRVTEAAKGIISTVDDVPSQIKNLAVGAVKGALGNGAIANGAGKLLSIGFNALNPIKLGQNALAAPQNVALMIEHAATNPVGAIENVVTHPVGTVEELADDFGDIF